MPSRWRSPSSSDRSGARTRRFAVLGLAVVGLALSGAFVAGCGVATTTAAQQQPAGPARPSFDHKGHLARGVGCTDCHETAEDGDHAGMPTRETCWECHEEIDEEKPPEKKIDAFAKTPGGPLVWGNVTKVPDEVIFRHDRHAKAKVACKDCHTGIEESSRVTPEVAVDMDECMACHTQRKAQNECATCHSAYGTEAWKPKSHDLLWETLHGQVVRRNAPPNSRAEDCSLCHTQNDCASCHRSEPPRDHTNAWRTGGGHGLAAAMDRDRCQACHEVHSCEQCHLENEPRSHRAGWGSPRNRHCLNCHLPLRRGTPEGCGTCHTGTPSHSEAPRMPPWHRPDFQCRLCHANPHPDNGQNCLLCHR